MNSETLQCIFLGLLLAVALVADMMRSIYRLYESDGHERANGVIVGERQPGRRLSLLPVICHDDCPYTTREGSRR